MVNRDAQGKRKLADMWELVVHTVVASKPALHIYCIRDQVGNKRVVHCNLLLEVSFLSVNAASSDDAAQPARSLAGVRSDMPDAEVDAASTCLSLTESHVSSSSDSSTARTSA